MFSSDEPSQKRFGFTGSERDGADRL